ncbi:hypothetical protein L1999_15310 [Neobacillus drentensis]|uniref:hypothetical protein n=1 Tax=Neobacillus drentensis TaxID=220684 RepID=UPI001F25B5F1|nr:hypothetical protein [Neobacillus drentensis]ULT54534.1 hypothetical protein L1999_15310 [Neobacillus drentensis]
MTNYQGLKEIIRIADEISCHANDRDYDNDTYRLKRALDLTARALSMFAKMEQERIDGEIVIHNPLEYIEARLCTALYYVKNPTKDGKRIDSPKP